VADCFANNSFFAFLLHEWKADKYASIVEGRKIYVGFEKCFKFTASDRKIRCEEVELSTPRS
jgi:hypothetical protein